MKISPNEVVVGGTIHDWMVEVERRLGMPPHPAPVETIDGGAADDFCAWAEHVEERLKKIQRTLDEELRPTVVQGLVDQLARRMDGLAAEVQRLRDEVVVLRGKVSP